MKKVFIDGKEGTTGLRIYQRLSVRDDIQLITLAESERKQINARKKALNEADIAFLCLPDAAAKEAVGLIENPDTIIIDTSTAHRTDDAWAYGFPELSEESFKRIKTSKRIAVPGCHASGFIALVYPLTQAGVLVDTGRLTCHSITGYSGGGKKMIAQYKEDNRDILLDSPRQYGITQCHKHLKEMQAVTGISAAPIFCPIVADYYSGMVVTVPIFKSDLKSGLCVDDIKQIYKSKYSGPVVTYVDSASDDGFIAANKLTGKDSMNIFVEGNEDRILLIAQYDNLGKGASGAAVQCLNIALGAEIKTGLDL